MKGIADTGFLVAFQNRTDRFHQWALDIAAQITEPLLTCESVLSEAALQVGSTEDILALVEDGLIRLSFDCSRQLAPLQELARRYADRHPDFADLCLMRMSEIFPRHSIVTVDSDFKLYRRNKREVIPTICPPRK